MKGLKNILLVSWTAKKTNEWVLNKAGVKMEGAAAGDGVADVVEAGLSHSRRRRFI